MFLLCLQSICENKGAAGSRMLRTCELTRSLYYTSCDQISDIMEAMSRINSLFWPMVWGCSPSWWGRLGGGKGLSLWRHKCELLTHVSTGQQAMKRWKKSWAVNLKIHFFQLESTSQRSYSVLKQYYQLVMKCYKSPWETFYIQAPTESPWKTGQ